MAQIVVEESEGEENNGSTNPAAGFSLIAQQKACNSAAGLDLDNESDESEEWRMKEMKVNLTHIILAYMLSKNEVK